MNPNRSPRSRLVLELATFLAAATLCAAPAAEPTASSAARGGGPALRVGVAGNQPPMAFKEKEALVGVEIDLARALGKELGREIRFVEVPWEGIIDALSEGKIDIIMSAMSMTRARQFRVAFSEPYLRIGQMALVRAEEKFRFVGPLATSLGSQVLGVKKGTTGDLLVQQEFPRAKRKFFKSGEEVVKALKKGSINAFIGDSTMVWYLAGIYEAEGLVVAPTLLSEEVLAWGMNRNDSELQVAVNAFLKKVKASGELDKVLQRWIPKFQ